MFKLLRYYSVTSLIAVLAAAVVLTWYYRQASIHGIVDLTERSNLTLARAVIDPMKPALLGFLAATAHVEPGGAHPVPLPPELTEPIHALMRDRTVARIKIYNRHGVIVFSTWPSQIGGDQSRNEGFLAAMRGGVASAMVYRDTFNRFDRETEEDNLAQTYVPVRIGPAAPIDGVFEIYSDVNRLVLLTERTEFIVMIGSVVILSSLYAALLLIVRRAAHVIDTQQRTIRERTETLEMLSAQMLKSEESHKKKLAFELHEGLVQTLAALKLQAESGRLDPKGGDAAIASLESIIPVLQDTIREARAIATELRPPSLDDLGLLPTLNWFFREFEAQHPGIRIEREISLKKDDVPAALKIIVYRIIASVLGDMAERASPERIRVGLWRARGTLTLQIDGAIAAEAPMASEPAPRGSSRMEELATLSGGVFKIAQHADGGATLRAAWSV